MQSRRRILISFLVLLGASLSAAAGNGVESLIEKGQEQAGQGRLDEALTTLNSAVEQHPESSLAYTRLGGVRVLRQEYSKSIESFQRAIMLDQSNANAFVGLAVAYLHLGQYTHAREALKQAEKLDASKKAEIGKLLAWIDKRSNRAVH